MTKKNYFLAWICLLALLLLISTDQNIVFATGAMQTTDEFLGPIYYGTEDMWNIFDHDQDTEDVVSFDGKNALYPTWLLER